MQSSLQTASLLVSGAEPRGDVGDRVICSMERRRCVIAMEGEGG